MGCAGNHDIKTPAIDGLAREGMRFDHAFCGSPVCSPARASLLTGRIPSYHGVHDWLRSGNLDPSLCPEAAKENLYAHHYAYEDKAIRYLEGIPAYTDLLAAAGYTCALSGKWHLGDSVHPQHGFTKWYSLGVGGADYYHADMVEDGQVHMRHGQYVTDLITDRAIDYLREMKDTPFYLGVHYTAPHSPWGASHHPEEFLRLYERCAFRSAPCEPRHENGTMYPDGGNQRREWLTGYYAAVSAMDAGIGRILSKLDALGLRDNTLVVFTSDNGMNMGHHGVWGKGNGTFPLNMYDTSVKVPLVARFPGVIPAGEVCGGMTSAYDWFPTLLDLTGNLASLPDGLPGKSILPWLEGKTPEEDSVVVYDEYGPTRMIRTPSIKYVHHYPYGKNELYNLINDPEERRNLIDDPAYRETARQMAAEMETWFDRYMRRGFDGASQDVRGAGQLSPMGEWHRDLLRFARQH